MRSQPRQHDGPVRGTGPLAGSASGVDHHAHRQEVFGDYRDLEVEVEEPFAEEGPGTTSPVEPDEAARIFVSYHTTPMTLEEVGEIYGRADWTVSQIARRKGRYGEMQEVAEVEVELKAKGEL